MTKMKDNVHRALSISHFPVVGQEDNMDSLTPGSFLVVDTEDSTGSLTPGSFPAVGTEGNKDSLILDNFPAVDTEDSMDSLILDNFLAVDTEDSMDNSLGAVHQVDLMEGKQQHRLAHLHLSHQSDHSSRRLPSIQAQLEDACSALRMSG